MRIVVQRVRKASVSVNGKQIGSISKGLMILVSIEHADTKEDAEWLSQKICKLRIFDDENGVMNQSLLDVNGEILVVSQFTLHARTQKGNRPSYTNAAKPPLAVPIYQHFINKLKANSQLKIEVGQFGASMDVALVNEGPVTIIIDTKNKE